MLTLCMVSCFFSLCSLFTVLSCTKMFRKSLTLIKAKDSENARLIFETKLMITDFFNKLYYQNSEQNYKKEKKVAANRKPRTEEQKRKAAEAKKLWWEKKRSQGKVSQIPDVSDAKQKQTQAAQNA